MNIDIGSQIPEFTVQAQRLEDRISVRSSQQQLREIAQEAAGFHRIIAIALIRNISGDRKLLTALSQKFNSIEFEASRLHYCEKRLPVV